MLPNKLKSRMFSLQQFTYNISTNEYEHPLYGNISKAHIEDTIRKANLANSEVTESLEFYNNLIEDVVNHKKDALLHFATNTLAKTDLTISLPLPEILMLASEKVPKIINQIYNPKSVMDLVTFGILGDNPNRLRLSIEQYILNLTGEKFLRYLQMFLMMGLDVTNNIFLLRVLDVRYNRYTPSFILNMIHIFSLAFELGYTPCVILGESTQCRKCLGVCAMCSTTIYYDNTSSDGYDNAIHVMYQGYIIECSLFTRTFNLLFRNKFPVNQLLSWDSVTSLDSSIL